MNALKITRNEIHVLYKVLCIMIIMATNVRLLFYQIVDTVIVIRFLVCVIISVLLWSLKSFVYIDLDNKKISEGYSVLGLRLITTYKATFTEIEKMYVNYITSGWTSDSLGYTEGKTPPMYKAFLKTSEGDKFCVAVGASKREVMARVRTFEYPFWV